MSPRAACRLATLGFTAVYDYLPSKVDWMARGLPIEGELADQPRAIDVARHDVVTCRPDDTMGAVAEWVAASPYGFALVTSEDGVILGRLRKAALTRDAGVRAEDAMEAGPSTNRPDTAPDKLRVKLVDKDLSTAVLSDPDGRLLGLVRRDDLTTG